MRSVSENNIKDIPKDKNFSILSVKESKVFEEKLSDIFIDFKKYIAGNDNNINNFIIYEVECEKCKN
ncbi:MAG: hypothetical protein PHT36_01365 [Patescibacteria group bacterium]|nr:hypothetical protein [Patescibacteria group bacterium]